MPTFRFRRRSPPYRWRRRLGLLLLLAASVPGPARAHSELRRAEPAQGAVLAEPPTELRLVFNEPVQVTAFRLLDAAGRAVPLRRDGDASPSREERAVPVAPVPSGPWRIEWRAISADGHPIRGAIQFQVQGGGTP